MAEYVSIEKVLEPQEVTADVELSFGTVEIKAISRAKTLQNQKKSIVNGKMDSVEFEALSIASGMKNPAMSYEQAFSWMQEGNPEDLAKIVEGLSALAGNDTKEVIKEAMSSFL